MNMILMEKQHHPRGRTTTGGLGFMGGLIGTRLKFTVADNRDGRESDATDPMFWDRGDW